MMSETVVMCAGLRLGTISTSVLVANSTGLSTSPFAYRSAGCFELAAANTSAGAPCSICVSSAPEPPNVYFAAGSMIGKTFVSDAAAKTVGCDPPAGLEPEAAGECEGVELLAQPSASTESPAAASVAAKRRAKSALKVWHL
jgi:hypothetical protein